MVRRIAATAAISLLVLGAAACGDDDSDSNNTGDPTPAACLVGDQDCYETGADPLDD